MRKNKLITKGLAFMLALGLIIGNGTVHAAEPENSSDDEIISEILDSSITETPEDEELVEELVMDTGDTCDLETTEENSETPEAAAENDIDLDVEKETDDNSEKEVEVQENVESAQNNIIESEGLNNIKEPEVQMVSVVPADPVDLSDISVPESEETAEEIVPDNEESDEWREKFEAQLETMEAYLDNYSFDNRSKVEKLISQYKEQIDSIVDQESFMNIYNEMMALYGDITPARVELENASGIDASTLTEDQKVLFTQKIQELRLEFVTLTTQEEKEDFLSKVPAIINEYLQSGQEEIDRIEELEKRIEIVFENMVDMLQEAKDMGLSGEVIDRAQTLHDFYTKAVRDMHTIEEVEQAYASYCKELIAICGDSSVVEDVDPDFVNYSEQYLTNLNENTPSDFSKYSIIGKNKMESIKKAYTEYADSIWNEDELNQKIQEYIKEIGTVVTARDEILANVKTDDSFSEYQKKLFEEIVSQIEKELIAANTVEEANSILSQANERVYAYLQGSDKPKTDNEDSKTDQSNGGSSGNNATSAAQKEVEHTVHKISNVIDANGNVISANVSVNTMADETKNSLIEKIDTVKAPGDIVWFYDVNAQDWNGNLTFTLDLPGYAGKQVTIVHFINGTQPEYITPIVTNNTITFTVSSLSPIAIVVADKNVQTTLLNGSQIQTGDAAPVGAMCALGITSAGIICYIMKKRKEV